MKKLLFSAIVLCIAMHSHAQYQVVLSNENAPKQISPSIPLTSNFYVDGMQASERVGSHHGKYRSTPFASDNFSSGTISSLPSGWTSGGSTTSCVWVWKNSAFAGVNNIGTINSTTSSNGWLGFDSDGIGNSITGAFDSWVQKTFNCSGHSTVALTFQTRFRKYADSCMVRISTNGGATWTNYWLSETNSMVNNELTDNSASVFLNISASAANQPNVIIRFHYYNTITGGAFNWLIDDLNLAELDPIDVKIQKSSFSAFGTYTYYAYRSIPASLQDTLLPFTFYSNLGTNGLSNVNVNGTYYKGTSNVGSTIISQPSLPFNAIDSGRYAGSIFTTTGVGDYKCDLNLNLSGDANASNNIDSVKFSVHDSIYSLNDGLIIEAYICHQQGSSASTELKFSIGNLFEVPISDTLTQAFVSFTSSTQVGAQVVAGLYEFNGLSWNYVMGSDIKTLTAADISTSTNVIYTRLNFPSTSFTNILSPGLYAIAVEPYNPSPTSQNVYINSSQDFDVVHQFGAYSAYTSQFSFGLGALPSGSTSTPLIAAVFGHGNANTTVNNSLFNKDDLHVSTFPNPASNEICFQFKTIANTQTSSIEIVNAFGQRVKTIHLGSKQAGSEISYWVSVADLKPGVYAYILSLDDKKYINKLMVH